MALWSAKRVNSLLHHADFWITRDPAIVEATAVMPEHADCVTYVAGRDQALARVTEHPDRSLIVGQLHFC